MKYIVTAIAGLAAILFMLAFAAVYTKRQSKRQQRREKRQRHWSLNKINRLNQTQFEALCRACFTLEGYRTDAEPLSKNGGLNIILSKESYYRQKPCGIVLCRSSTDHVDIKSIKELRELKEHYDVPLAVLISRGTFSQTAYRFSRWHDLTLINTESLLQLIQSLSHQTQIELTNEIVKSEHKAPNCPSCGEKMSLKRSRNNRDRDKRYWRCINSSKCSTRVKLATH